MSDESELSPGEAADESLLKSAAMSIVLIFLPVTHFSFLLTSLGGRTEDEVRA